MNVSELVRRLIRGAPAPVLVLGLSIATGLQPGVATAAPAQDGPGNTDNTSSALNAADGQIVLDDVVVTGTSIKRINAETALPVQVISREDIARTGATTLEELFQQVSAADSAGHVDQAQQTGTLRGAISTISLRGLGSARTLVLIDGKRNAVYGGASANAAGSSVDISAIPIASIERIEILKDGASSVYGSDAIAGVVNIITRTNFQGAEVSASGGTPTDKGGGQQETASAYVGKGDIVQDRYNVSLGFNFDHNSALMGSDRDFATRYSPGYGNDGTSSFGFPGNVAIPKNTLVPKGAIVSPGAGACGSTAPVDINYPTQCRFDNSPYDSLEPEVRKFSLSFDGHYAATDRTQFYTQDSYSEVQTTTFTQPAPLSYQNTLLPSNSYNAYLANLLATQYPTYKNSALTPNNAAFLLGPSSPYYPTAFAAANGQAGQPLNVIYRDFANGSRESLDTANTLRLVGGFKGDTGGWDFDSWLLYSQVKVREDLVSGYPEYSEIMPLLDSGVINPFGPTTDPTALAAAQNATFVGQDFNTKTSIASLNGRVSREIITLPYGALTGAAGAEFRREKFEYDPAEVIEAGNIAGIGGNQEPENHSRNVESAFVEFNAGLYQGLEADVAARFDNYQGVGNTVNPKLSLRYQPVQMLVVRASGGTGFRAPSLTDLYASQATGITANGTRDPVQCPTFNANNPACSFQFTTITGGNPNLKPEKSQSYTFGVAVEPVKDLNINLDSFWIFLKDQIVVGGLPYQDILLNAGSAAEFAGLVNRSSTGQIVSIEQTNANLFKSALSGLDMDLKYGLQVGQSSRVTLLGTGTYFYRDVAQNFDGSWTSQLDQGLAVQSVSQGGVVSRFRANTSAIYEIGPVGASLTENYQKRYHDVASNITEVSRYVSAYETTDGQFFYTPSEILKLTLGAKNIFNRAPPYANYANTVNNFVGGYDLSYGDPLGRYVYLNVTYSLR
jgi:iron complex outermembrane recepter protein